MGVVGDCMKAAGKMLLLVFAQLLTHFLMKMESNMKVRTPISNAAAENYASQGDCDAGMTERMMVPLGVAQELEERLINMTVTYNKLLIAVAKLQSKYAKA